MRRALRGQSSNADWLPPSYYRHKLYKNYGWNEEILDNQPQDEVDAFLIYIEEEMLLEQEQRLQQRQMLEIMAALAGIKLPPVVIPDLDNSSGPSFPAPARRQHQPATAKENTANNDDAPAGWSPLTRE